MMNFGETADDLLSEAVQQSIAEDPNNCPSKSIKDRIESAPQLESPQKIG